MKKLLSILFIALPFFAGAQNYQCLQSGIKHYFANDDGYLRGIRIDSVRTSGSTTIYYPYRTTRGYYDPSGPPQTLDTNGGSWLGKQVVELSDGTFLFDNLWHDTVIIKTKANVGDTWVFYNDTTTLYYQAALVAEDTMTVSGAIDSIKKILITAYNPSGIVTTDPTDSFQIILSKNHGFAQVFDLYTFPYHAPDSAYRQSRDYYLDQVIHYSGIPTLQNSIFSMIDLINPTYAELFQWNVGDVYEYSVCNSAFEHYTPECTPVEQYLMDTVSSVDTSYGVTYTFTGTASNYLSPLPVSTTGTTPGPYTYVTSPSGGIIPYSPGLLIDTTLMPEEKNQMIIYGYFPNDSNYCIKSPFYALTTSDIRNDNYFPAGLAFAGAFNYKTQLGLITHYEWYMASPALYPNPGYNVYFQNLLYWNKGGITCGTLYTPPESVNNIKRYADLIVVSPNPASSELNISSPEKITSITINNIFGQSVFNQEYYTEKAQLDISYLPVGIYFARINDANSNSVVKKFVKQ